MMEFLIIFSFPTFLTHSLFLSSFYISIMKKVFSSNLHINATVMSTPYFFASLLCLAHSPFSTPLPSSLSPLSSPPFHCLFFLFLPREVFMNQKFWFSAVLSNQRSLNFNPIENAAELQGGSVNSLRL